MQDRFTRTLRSIAFKGEAAKAMLTSPTSAQSAPSFFTILKLFRKVS
jgi:hypothetical protein